MKQTVIWNIEQGQRLTGADVARAERLRTELFHRLRAFFERYDFIAGPVVQVLPFDVSVEYPMSIGGVAMGSYIEWMKSCYLVSATGLPALSVPAGFSRGGLPVGLQLIGRHRDDLGVLQLGHAFERATGSGRQRPPAIPAPV
jgi:amidase